MFKKSLFALTTGAALIAATASFAETTTYSSTGNSYTTTTKKVDPDKQAANGRTGLAAGAVTGALVGGPIGAVVGGAIGAATGNAATEPDTTTVTTYVQQNPVQPVIVQGTVAPGYVMPNDVVLTPVPQSQYSYVYTENRQVLVDPSTRRVIRVIE